jgi:hypothetical protein
MGVMRRICKRCRSEFDLEYRRGRPREHLLYLPAPRHTNGRRCEAQARACRSEGGSVMNDLAGQRLPHRVGAGIGSTWIEGGSVSVPFARVLHRPALPRQPRGVQRRQLSLRLSSRGMGGCCCGRRFKLWWRRRSLVGRIGLCGLVRRVVIGSLRCS